MHHLPPVLPQPCFTSISPRLLGGGSDQMQHSQCLQEPAALQHLDMSFKMTHYVLFFLCDSSDIAHKQKGDIAGRFCVSLFSFMFEFPVNFRCLPLSSTISRNWWHPTIPVPIWTLLWQISGRTFWSQSLEPSSSCILAEPSRVVPLPYSATFMSRTCLFWSQVFGQGAT